MSALFLLFCLAIPVIGLVYVFWLGVRAFKASSGFQGPYATTLRYLGLSLVEPGINTPLVLLAISMSSKVVWLLVLIVVLMMFIPLHGASFSNPLYRGISLKIFWLSIGRIAISASSWLLVWIAGQVQDWTLVVSVGFLPLAGIVLLGYCAFWGRRLLHGALANPPAPVPLPTSVARVAPAQPPVVFIPPPPPDPARAIACPVCSSPTALEAEGCSDCGLLFASRIPETLHTVPGYTILRPIGRGGMSSVYLARAEDHQLCVIKTLTSIDGNNGPQWQIEALECLQREAHLLARIDHPGIARLIDRIDGHSNNMMVLEYIKGQSLHQHMNHPALALSIRASLMCAAHVAETLAYLSNLPCPVVHCDIKPSNLMIRREGQPVLIDFGGATLLADDSHTTIRLEHYGTPGYAAPELYRGLATPHSDVYGLAATLYHLLTHDDPTAHPLMFPKLAALPGTIARILIPALAPDPDARPDAGQFAANLRAAVHG